ncbi:hypothetical protein [Microbacterium halotolerans]|uniref:hypothetical protein n=1 Tax=Microbacterium halotolerans TaxID=246613 RepID=UPI0013C35DB1|nr:hypothetical protein [Microbacterium halotolerans]
MTDEEPVERAKCSETGCDLADAHDHYSRFIFLLPELIGLEDRFESVQVYHSSAGDQRPTFARLTVHQVETPVSASLAAADHCTAIVASRVGLYRQQKEPTDSGDSPTELRSVADVITRVCSPTNPPVGWDGAPANLGPHEDAFMRALHATRTVVRAANLIGDGRPAVEPTYERMPPIVVKANSVCDAPPSLETAIGAVDELEWPDIGIMILENRNFPDAAAEPTSREVFDIWLKHAAGRTPTVHAREKLVEARRLIHYEGEYAAGVTIAATAVEVLCDAVLSALLWESAFSDPTCDLEQALKEAASVFSNDVTPLKRATSELAPRLGGDWTSEKSPWKEHRGCVAALRNRIVHAGYEPARQEALEVLQKAHDTQHFIITRLAARAKDHPRVTYLFVGKEGLEKRGQYSHHMKTFFEETVFQEPSCVESFTGWHQALIDIVNEQ